MMVKKYKNTISIHKICFWLLYVTFAKDYFKTMALVDKMNSGLEAYYNDEIITWFRGVQSGQSYKSV